MKGAQNQARCQSRQVKLAYTIDELWARMEALANEGFLIDFLKGRRGDPAGGINW